MAIEAKEAARWALVIKMILELFTFSSGKKVTLANLDEMIQDEEVRSKVLEAETASLMAASQT